MTVDGGPILLIEIGRGERIRTSDPSVPNRVLYQAEPRPDKRERLFYLNALDPATTASARPDSCCPSSVSTEPMRRVGGQVRLQRRDRHEPVLDGLVVRAVVRLPLVLPFLDPVVRPAARILRSDRPVMWLRFACTVTRSPLGCPCGTFS